MAKLDIFPKEVEARQKIGGRYTDLIKKHLETYASLSQVVSVPYIEPYNLSVYAQYTIEVLDRDFVQKHMNDQNIPTALHQQPVFLSAEASIKDYPVSESAASRVVSLPMHPYLNEKEMSHICSEIVTHFSK